MGKDFKMIKWQDRLYWYELQARNVMGLNPDASIQLTLSKIPKGLGKIKNTCIDIPITQVNNFLEAIQ